MQEGEDRSESKDHLALKRWRERPRLPARPFYFLVSVTRAKGVRLPASSLSISQLHVSAVLL